jgi:DNA-binding MarR family transcriptional regulator
LRQLFLERQGFIACEEQGKRRYKANFVLTERGKEVATLIAAKIDKVIMIAGEELSDEEREIFYRALEKISARLDTIANN